MPGFKAASRVHTLRRTRASNNTVREYRTLLCALCPPFLLLPSFPLPLTLKMVLVVAWVQVQV